MGSRGTVLDSEFGPLLLNARNQLVVGGDKGGNALSFQLAGDGVEVNATLVQGHHLPASAQPLAAPALPLAPQAARSHAARTVLVIDDEAGVRQVAARMLERLAYQVVAAAGGQEGLDLLAARPEISCVLLDLTMPGLSGEETLRQIRRHRLTLSVIIASGYSVQEVRERLGELPVLAVLQKPFTLAELREVMQGVPDEALSSRAWERGGG